MVLASSGPSACAAVSTEVGDTPGAGPMKMWSNSRRIAPYHAGAFSRFFAAEPPLGGGIIKLGRSPEERRGEERRRSAASGRLRNKTGATSLAVDRMILATPELRWALPRRRVQFLQASASMRPLESTSFT